jgi:hypothetical protein
VNLTTGAVDFTQIEDQLMSRWLYAVTQQYLAQDHDTRERWESAAKAWEETARACPQHALADVALLWTLAADAAKKARA